MKGELTNNEEKKEFYKELTCIECLNTWTRASWNEWNWVPTTGHCYVHMYRRGMWVFIPLQCICTWLVPTTVNISQSDLSFVADGSFPCKVLFKIIFVNQKLFFLSILRHWSMCGMEWMECCYRSPFVWL